MKLRSFIIIAAAVVGTSEPAAAQTVVPVPRFEGFALQGGGRVVVRRGSQQRVTIVQGDPSVTALSVSDGRLQIRSCDEGCPPRYRLVLEIISPTIAAIAIEGGGKIDVEGAFPRRDSLALAIRGGGVIDAEDVPARSVAALIRGGGAIRTDARQSIAASIRGGGSVTYLGNPSVSTSIRGGGSVKRAASN